MANKLAGASQLGPEKWAIRITHMLNEVLGADHFPIDVSTIALEYSHQIYPEDPITLVKSDTFSNFDGALVRAPESKSGWGIIFNNNIDSSGRINFTLGHEFGHYLLHRLSHPQGIYCSADDVVRWESELGKIEHQANVFSSYLLMPLDDFRNQIDSRSKIDFDIISHCAIRYDVSLIAATLRWLNYTETKSILVLSRDGFILWARSSKSALRNRLFFYTSKNTIPIPDKSIANNANILKPISNEPIKGIWFEDLYCNETTIFSERYDFVITLLQFE